MGCMVRLYLSSARRALSEGDLQQIVATSRRRNADARVSGMLLFGNNRFLQLLEGPGPAVERTYRRVLSDARHRDAMLVYDGIGEPQRFTEWPMAFVRAECVRGVPALASLIDLADGDDVRPLRPDAALKLFLDLRRELCRQKAELAAS